MSRLRIVVLGGGNGISAVLEGFARLVAAGMPLEVTAVVATADDGGSSGRLRRDRGGLPPGDLRTCLLALAGSGDRPFTRLFAYRYEGNGELGGHALGNLILAALADMEGGFLAGLAVAEDLLAANGRVLPVTEREVLLEGRCKDGSRLSGEASIGRATSIEEVWLVPGDVAPSGGVLETIREADLVVVGPGSLFTSILPVLLVAGVSDAVREARGRRVLVANLMSQPGETLGMHLTDHLRVLDAHAGAGLVEDVLVHEGPLDADRLLPYNQQGASPVDIAATDRPERLHRTFLVTASGKIRHDAARVSDALLRLAGPASPTAASAARGAAQRGL